MNQKSIHREKHEKYDSDKRITLWIGNIHTDWTE